MALEELSAKLFFKEDHVEIDFCPINVSKNGLSIYSTTYLPLDSEVILALDVKHVPLKVKWCKTNPDDQATYRAGLETVDQNEKLDELVQTELGGRQ